MEEGYDSMTNVDPLQAVLETADHVAANLTRETSGENGNDCLAWHLPADELRGAVQPLIESLERLEADVLLNLVADGKGARVSKQQYCRPIHQLVTPSYKNQRDIVRYLAVADTPTYSVGIFVFPPGSKIPLHDHPDMVVVSRVLYGDFRVESYDLIDAPKKERSTQDTAVAQPTPTHPPSIFRASFQKLKSFMSFFSEVADEVNDRSLYARPNAQPLGVDGDNLSAPNVTCLYPHEGNFHSFVAGPDGAAVLDILLPPYEDGERDCTFYETRRLETDFSEHDVFRLVPIPAPDDFHCYSGSYGRFGRCA
mmetsp:Transcript_38183/g.91404  ORF Transcript_38183/g.91404 Transcript_38183/m.91404 type:complete len:310 (-) Transcript_38183:125-1054(-)